MENNLIEWKKIVDGDKVHWKVYQKHYIGESLKYSSNNWYDIDGNKKATREVNDLFGKMKYFDHPKPVNFLKRLLQISALKNEDIILDFFSGSGTTAHAIQDSNAESACNYRFILVQLPEATIDKSEAYKAGYINICEIGKERIRRAAKSIYENKLKSIEGLQWELAKLIKENRVIDDEKRIDMLNQEIINLEFIASNLDTGFRVYRLSDSNMQDVYYKPQDYTQGNLDLFTDNVKPDRTADDLLAQVMLDWGLPLSSKIEKSIVNGKQLFKVSENSLYACFDKGIDESFAEIIAEDSPLRIVFRDNGFMNDTAKTNVKQLLKQLSPETEMKVI